MRRAARAGWLVALVAATVGCATPDVPRGTAPTYLDAPTRGVPNEAALGRRIWTPALDEGFVPQGLASAGGHLFVSSYHPSPGPTSNTGPCRVFRLDAQTGRTTGTFDLPEGDCTHSGGLAWLRDGTLLLADTHRLFRIDVERALATGRAAGAMQTFALAGRLRGSFATFDGTDMWIGTWTKHAPDARMYRLSTKLFDQYDGRTVDDSLALESIAIPVECQGAAVDASGRFWVSASNGQWGRLYRIGRHGEIEAQYEMVAGLEDLTIDAAGNLWGLSESGTRKYLRWPTKYPYIFRIDVGRLQ